MLIELHRTKKREKDSNRFGSSIVGFHVKMKLWGSAHRILREFSIDIYNMAQTAFEKNSPCVTKTDSCITVTIITDPHENFILTGLE